MGQNTTTITSTRFFRQDSKPPDAPDGAAWLTNVDGSGNDTTSRYQYNADADQWELNSAVGPSEPAAGVPVPGSTWRDTAGSGILKQYDGVSFVSITPDPVGYTLKNADESVTRDLGISGTINNSNKSGDRTEPYSKAGGDLEISWDDTNSGDFDANVYLDGDYVVAFNPNYGTTFTRAIGPGTTVKIEETAGADLVINSIRVFNDVRIRWI